MKRYLQISTAFVLLSLTTLSCRDAFRLREDFEMNVSSESLVIDGRTILSFDANRCQAAYSPAAVKFRVGDDMMNSYYLLDADRAPSGVGSRIKGNLSWTTETQVKSRRGLDFEVVKVEGDKFWLWNRKARIGLVVRELH